MVQRRSGSIVENANRISLLRDTDGDGVAEEQFVFLEGLRQPFGMALVGDQLYVANTDSVVRFPYQRRRHAASPTRAPSCWTCPSAIIGRGRCWRAPTARSCS